MRFKARAAKLMDRLVDPHGVRLVPKTLLYDWQLHPEGRTRYTASPSLPPGADTYLSPDNARLKELERIYAQFPEVATPFVWKEGYVTANDLLLFRSDNPYVWQLRGRNLNRMSYALTTYYIKGMDRLRLLDRLKEDQYFGAVTLDVADLTVSRDLLDSILEIYFLDKHLRITASEAPLNMLDIGAGYGRLAHRLVTAVPGLASYLCTDAVAVSTFVAEYYVQFRGLDPTVSVVPLHEIEDRLRNSAIDVAVNIHSFSECTLSAIHWWVSRLAKASVKYLMVIPNAGDHGGDQLLTNDGLDMRAVIEENGYRLNTKEPKYSDLIVQEYGLSPTYYYLFALIN